jgi:hypothetical protein
VFYTLHKILTYSGQKKEDEVFGICSLKSKEIKRIQNFDKNVREKETAWGTQTQIEYSKMASKYIRYGGTCFNCRHVNEPYQFSRDVSLSDSQ